MVEINEAESGLLFLHLTLAGLAAVPTGLTLDTLQDADESLHHTVLLGSLGYAEKPCYIVLQLLVLEV